LFQIACVQAADRAKTVEDGLQMPLAFAAPLTVTEDKVIMWQGFNAPVTSIYDTISLLPLGLYIRSDITGRDPSKWKVTGWVYNNTFYKDLDAFRKVIAEPDFKPLGANLDQPWAHTNKHGDALPLDDSPPPASVQSGKERFSVDAEESYVTWSESESGPYHHTMLTDCVSGFRFLC
jgi:primary-amine oxidase